MTEMEVLISMYVSELILNCKRYLRKNVKKFVKQNTMKDCLNYIQNST